MQLCDLGCLLVKKHFEIFRWELPPVHCRDSKKANLATEPAASRCIVPGVENHYSGPGHFLKLCVEMGPNLASSFLNLLVETQAILALVSLDHVSFDKIPSCTAALLDTLNA